MREPAGDSPILTDAEKTALAKRNEADTMDRIPLPGFNPWLALALLVIAGFLYNWLWSFILGG